MNEYTPNEPLAYRMSPESLDEYIGQEKVIGKGRLLRRMIEADRLSSIILFGPPGTGKTALARLIAKISQTPFTAINAVTAGVADIRAVISDAQNAFLTPEGKRLLFIDEIHRFNKAQQDALLPQVENGTIILIGATTENPFFEVNKALISRSTVFQLEKLTMTDIKKILSNALEDKTRGLGKMPLEITAEALDFIADLSDGDARIALNALELAALTTMPQSDARIHLDAQIMLDCMQRKSPAYDKNGENHYDNISAFIKSMRGSDPDATIFYLARALYGGEAIEFLARRILICAAEDVGLANPQILSIAMAAYQGAVAVGMPEARIILAEAALAVATSPKSNSAYLAINQALADVSQHRTGEVPLHLRNAPLKGMEDLGYKKGYKYAHDYPGHIVKQQYLPDERVGTKYYQATDLGSEAKIKEWLESQRKNQD